MIFLLNFQDGIISYLKNATVIKSIISKAWERALMVATVTADELPNP